MPTPSPRVALLLRLVAEIPPRRATTYGLLAEAVGHLTGKQMPALAAGRAMGSNDGSLAWWRVIRSDGSITEPMAERTLEHWRAEGLPLRRRGERWCVDLRACLWDPITDSPLVAAVEEGASWEAAAAEPWDEALAWARAHAGPEHEPEQRDDHRNATRHGTQEVTDA